MTFREYYTLKEADEPEGSRRDVGELYWMMCQAARKGMPLNKVRQQSIYFLWQVAGVDEWRDLAHARPGDKMDVNSEMGRKIVAMVDGILTRMQADHRCSPISPGGGPYIR
jgi:3-hydroxymyristoyl/3-hydroxydecanoyl-(acyl carrier protein) dehydratase